MSAIVLAKIAKMEIAKIVLAKTVRAKIVIVNKTVMNTKDVWNIYHRDLQQFIISKVKDSSIADDILQDTFIKIHTKLSTLQDENKLKSWVFSIARNSVLDFFRTSNNTVSFEEFEETEKEPEENSENHSVHDCLRGILINLPKKYRQPLFLYDIKGLKQIEIANQLHLSLPTVKSQIQRARKQIAKGFMDCCGFVENEKGHLIGEVKPKEECRICK